MIDGAGTRSAQDIEAKLTAARTWLILDKPFLGALVLRLPLIEADPGWCKTTATDARAVYYNRAYIESLSSDQTKFVLAHEALHCALLHFNRRQHRDKRRWDVACDYAINPLLIADGLTPPPQALVSDAYAQMSAEEIYPYLPKSSDQRPLDQHIYDSDEPPHDADRGRGASRPGDSPTPPAGAPPENTAPEPPPAGPRGGGADSNTPPPPAGAGRPPPLTNTEGDALGLQWQQRLAGAAQQAQQAGRLGLSMARLVDHLLQPRLPWRALLARYMTSVARTDYSFARPSRREGPAILPSLHQASTDVVIVIDTSGSVDDEELNAFVAEVNAIKGQINAHVSVHACDDQLSEDGPWEFESWEEIKLPDTMEGGGGTRFTPAFDWAEQRDRQPDVLVYFTDAKGEFPAREPSFPVLWLVKGKGKVPWGQRIQLN